MKRTRIAAFALASALLALPASAAWVDSEWWNVDFTDQEPGDYHQVDHPSGEGKLEYGGVEFEQGSLNGVTNVSRQVNGAWVDHQPYASGVWTADPTDESYITNGVATNIVGGVETEWDLDNYLELSTQGNDLTWTPTNVPASLVNLVDARLRLVGSDSAPEIADFDPATAAHRVQTAVYLKNELDPDTGETTNSVLCVYAWDSTLNGGNGDNTWVELKAKNDDLEIKDGSWHHVQVSIDYTKTGSDPVVIVKVDEKDMVPVSGTSKITSANPEDAKAAGKVQEVCFRGTGAVDNFVGTTQFKQNLECDFAVHVYIDGVLQPFDEAGDLGNLSRIQHGIAGDSGDNQTLEFPYAGFKISDGTYAPPLYSLMAQFDATYTIEKVSLTNFVDGTETVVPFELPADDVYWCFTPLVETEEISIDYVDDLYQEGTFSLRNLVTDGATDPTNVIARIYFKTIGAFNADAVTEVGENVSTNSTIVKPATFKDGGTTNLVWKFADTDGANVLTGIRVENGAAATYSTADREATVSVTLSAALAADTTFVTATYEPGSYAKAPLWIDNEDGSYTLGDFVAKIDGDPKPAYFPTLQGAIDKCLEGQIVTMLADVRTTDETLVTNTVALDLNGHTITAGNTKGVALVGNTVPSKRWIRITTGGDLTLTNSVPGTGAIVSDEYLESNTGCCLVRVEENGRFTLNGGDIVDTVTIPVDGDGDGEFDGEDDGAYVANAVGVFGTAVVTINGGSITASGYAVSLNGSAAGENYSDGATITINGGAITATMGTALYVPAGSVTVNGGTLTGLGGVYAKGGRLVFPAGSTAVVTATATADEIFEWAAMYGGSNQTGEALTLDNSNYTYGPTLATIAGGTFVSSNAHAVACYAVEGATMGSKFVTGGWFSDQVAADYVADGYQCVQDADNAPNADATYTVKAAAVQLWDAETEANVGSAQLSIADAVAVAAANGVDVSNRVFVIIRPLAAETYLIASTNELFTVQTTNTEYTLNLTVETSLASSDALAYTVVGPMTVPDSTVDPPVSTITWYVKADEYVAKIVNADTTVDRFKTFEAAADVAVAYDSTVVMVADDRATTYTLEDGESLSVEEGHFAVPTVVPATLAEYYIVEAVDGDVTTYTSTAYLTATFLNGDDTTLDTVTGIRVGEAPATNSVPTPTKASEQAGHKWVFTGWTPSVETAITADQTYTPLFEDALVEYTLTYVTNDLAAYGASLPEGTANPTTFDITTETFALVAPVGYDTNDFAFAGWFVPGTDTQVTEVAQGTYDDVVVEPVFAEIYEIEFVVGNETKTTNVVEGAQIEYPYGTPELPDSAGWRFAFDGWSTNGVKLASLPVADQTYSFVALFTSNAIEYTVVYGLAGGENAAGNPGTYSVTDGEVVLADPTKDYYDFVEWTNSVGTKATAINYADADENDTISYGAVWTPTEYTITYVLDGGTNAVANPTNYTVETETFTLAPAGKDGFEFLGWVDENDATNAAPEIAQGSHGNRTFTAAFQPSTPPDVDVGDGLEQYKIDNPSATVPAPIEFTEPEQQTDKPLCKLSFVAPTSGRYILYSSTTVNGTYSAETGAESAKDVSEGELVSLIEGEPSATGAKFFKIYFVR